jgi:hypothetical protein
LFLLEYFFPRNESCFAWDQFQGRGTHEALSEMLAAITTERNSRPTSG